MAEESVGRQTVRGQTVGTEWKEGKVSEILHRLLVLWVRSVLLGLGP